MGLPRARPMSGPGPGAIAWRPSGEVVVRCGICRCRQLVAVGAQDPGLSPAARAAWAIARVERSGSYAFSEPPGPGWAHRACVQTRVQGISASAQQLDLLAPAPGGSP